MKFQNLKHNVDVQCKWLRWNCKLFQINRKPLSHFTRECFPNFCCVSIKKTCQVLNVFRKTCILPYSILNFLNVFWNICITFLWRFSCCNWMYPTQQHHPDKWVLNTSAQLKLTRLIQYDLDNKDNIFFITHLGSNLDSDRNWRCKM